MKGATVWFIDTSILLHVLRIYPLSKPGKTRETVNRDFIDRLRSNDAFILPITSVIETGNHICQLSDGRRRRASAEKLNSYANTTR